MLSELLKSHTRPTKPTFIVESSRGGLTLIATELQKENPGHEKTPLFTLYDNCLVLIVFLASSSSLTLQLWES